MKLLELIIVDLIEDEIQLMNWLCTVASLLCLDSLKKYFSWKH